MTLPLLGFCLGLLPGLLIALVNSYKVKADSDLLRERLAAEEASRRHFVTLSDKHEGTVALLTQELRRLEAENTLLRTRVPVAQEI